MILISHEMPKQLFPIHDFLNDYPYILAHLLMEGTEHYDKEYADFYREKLKESPYSILDNSLFELGDSIDYNILYKLGEEYKPTHLILPDKSHNKEVTMEQTMRYLLDYGKVSTPKFIGVVHGKKFEEILQMYQFYCTIPQIDIIAFPLNTLSFTDWSTSHPYSVNIEARYKLHRVEIVDKLARLFNCNLPKKIHLLGCITPVEYFYYNNSIKNNIFSIDTSAPIIYGWNDIDLTYKDLLNIPKPKDKLAENLDIKLNSKQMNLIAKNVKHLRNILIS